MTTSTRAATGELSRLLSLMTGAEKHEPSATSTLDVLWVLYDPVLRVSPHHLDDPDCDRFVLSKGRGPMAYYAVLTAHGFIPESWLSDFDELATCGDSTVTGSDSICGNTTKALVTPASPLQRTKHPSASRGGFRGATGESTRQRPCP